MKNLMSFKKEITLLSIGIILVVLALSNNFNILKTQTLGSERSASTPKPTLTPDPRKEFKSLDNYLSYTVPPGWKKQDHVDKESGNSAYLSLTSSDYDSPETYLIKSGVGIIISRTYDPKSEETLKTKLNSQYESYIYNILPTKIDNKNAMTMHEDYEGHNRVIYIANGNHLWQILIASKSLEDEARYQSIIQAFLNSLKFKS